MTRESQGHWIADECDRSVHGAEDEKIVIYESAVLMLASVMKPIEIFEGSDAG